MADEIDDSNYAASSAQCCHASRRGIMGAGLAAGTAAFFSQLVGGQVAAANQDATLQNLSNSRGSRILLKGGTVLSLDPKVGDFESADVLIQGKQILAIGRNIDAAAIVVDARGMIVMPGFIDTHHHQYQDALRSILSDGLLGPSTPEIPVTYLSLIQGVFTPLYLPEEAYISELVASLSEVNDGVTTTLDISQVNNSPAHTDALIQALQDSGRRAVFAYAGGSGPHTKYPQDIVRVQKQYFSSKDQLLTLASGAELDLSVWALARSIGVPIVSHAVGKLYNTIDALRAAAAAGAMGPDNEYIHCTELPDDIWQKISDTGGKVSVAPAIEMQMRHGLPPLQTALDRKVALSLSVDVECNMTSDLFSIMRTAFTLQRALLNERALHGEQNLPPLLTCYDTIKLATVGGATVTHLDHKIGTLTPGKEADIIMLDTNRINVFPLNNVPGSIVTLMDTSNVDTVFVAGAIKKWRGKLVGVDVDSLRRLIEQARDNLLARAHYKRRLFGSCCEAKGPLD